MSHPSAFKTLEGEARYLAAYDAALKLWPVPYDEIDIQLGLGGRTLSSADRMTRHRLCCCMGTWPPGQHRQGPLIALEFFRNESPPTKVPLPPGTIRHTWT